MHVTLDDNWPVYDQYEVCTLYYVSIPNKQYCNTEHTPYAYNGYDNIIIAIYSYVILNMPGNRALFI